MTNNSKEDWHDYYSKQNEQKAINEEKWKESNMITIKEKFIKILQVLIVFIAINFIASSFMKLNNTMGAVLYMLFGSLIIIYGFYLLKKKDNYLLKIFFYFIILIGILNVFLRVTNNI